MESAERRINVNLKNILIFTAVFLIIISSASAAQENLNLNEAVKILVQENRELENARTDIANAEADIDLAYRSFFPSISLDNSYTKLDEGRTSISGFQPDGSGGLVPITTEESDTTYSNTLRLTQPVWYGNEVLLNKDIAEFRIETARSNYESTLEDKIFSLVQAYYGVLQAEGLVEIREEALDIANEHLRIVENNLEAGLVIRRDLLQSKIEQRKAEEDLQAAENDLKIAKRRFNQLLTSQENYSLQKPELNLDLNLNQEELYQTAVENSAQLHSLEINKKIVEINKRIKEIPQRPRININGSYTWEGDKFFAEDESWSVTVTGSIPLYDGGKSKIEADKQQREIDKLNNSISDLLENIDIEIEDSILSVKELEEKIRLERLSLENAAESLEIANKSYQAGVAKNVDVINAQSTYRQAQISLLQSEYNYEIEKFRVLYKSGRISEYFEDVITNEK